MQKKTKKNKFVNERIVRKFFIGDSDSNHECDSISDDPPPPLSDIETAISDSMGTLSTAISDSIIIII